MISKQLLNCISKNEAHTPILNLSYLPITDDDLDKICIAMRQNNQVNSLLLNATGITDLGAYKIAALLRVNHHLKRVELARNSISDECVNKLGVEFNARFSASKNFLHRLALNPHRNIKPIEEVNNIDASLFFTQYYVHQRPLIVRDGISKQSTFANWSPSYLARKLKQADVELNMHIMSMDTDYYFSRMKPIRMKMYQAISIVEDPSPANSLTTRFNIHQSPLIDYPEIQNDIHLPEFACDIEKLERVKSLWITQKDGFAPLHYDNEDNIFIQVYGDKTFLIYPPEDSKYLCMNLLKNNNFQIYSHFSSIPNIDVIDEFYNHSRHTTPYHAKLSAGDVLFLPKGWWHDIRTLEKTSISVNFWFKPELKFKEVDDLAAALMTDSLGDYVVNKTTVLSNKNHAEKLIDKCAQILLERENPNYFIMNRYTLLHLAVFFNRIDLVRSLLMHPLVEPQARVCINHHTPFAVAITLGHLEIVKLFVKYHAIRVNQPFDNSMHTPLTLALECQSAAVVEYLRSILV